MEPRPLPEERPFLTPAEAAALTGFSENHIRNLIKRGECPGRRAGRAYTINRKAFEAWHRGEPRPTPRPASPWH